MTNDGTQGCCNLQHVNRLAGVFLAHEISVRERGKMWLDLELMISCVSSLEIKRKLVYKTLLMKLEQRVGSSLGCVKGKFCSAPGQRDVSGTPSSGMWSWPCDLMFNPTSLEFCSYQLCVISPFNT